MLAAIAAFRPQIIAALKKLGFRSGPSETGLSRGMIVVGAALAIFGGMILIGFLVS